VWLNIAYTLRAIKSSRFLGWAVVLKKIWVPIRTILFKVRLFSVCKVVHALRRQSFN
jgi:hypothetical protein